MIVTMFIVEATGFRSLVLTEKMPFQVNFNDRLLNMIHNRIGVAKRMLGNIYEAKRFLEHAIGLCPNDTTIGRELVSVGSTCPYSD
jgi:hypothetical protein